MNTQTLATNQNTATAWLNYFKPEDATRALIAHVAALPSTRRTGHTMKVYRAGLLYFLEWSQNHFPSVALIEQFIAHLKIERGLKSSTVASKYMAPVRLYLNKLVDQHIQTRTDGSELSITDRHAIIDFKEQIRSALNIKNPAPDTKTNMSALYAHGTRLSQKQLNDILAACDISTIKGKRDLALLYIAFTSALRLSELQQITLDKIEDGGDHYRLKVIGKRNNVDPVAIDATAVALLNNYIEAYNAPLAIDEPRRITNTSPVWQPIGRGDKHVKLGVRGYNPAIGLSADGLRHIIATISKRAIGVAITPHDCRRTFASLGRNAGMEWDQLQTQLRHKSIATTQRYVGAMPNLAKCLISTKLNIAIPQSA